MSFNEVLEELASLSFDQRQLLILRALQMDDPALPTLDEALVGERLAGHHLNPESSLSLDEVKARLRARLSK